MQIFILIVMILCFVFFICMTYKFLKDDEPDEQQHKLEVRSIFIFDVLLLTAIVFHIILNI